MDRLTVYSSSSMCRQFSRHRVGGMYGTLQTQNVWNSVARSDSPPNFGFRCKKTIITNTQYRRIIFGYNPSLKIPQISTLPISYLHCLLRQTSPHSGPCFSYNWGALIYITDSMKPWKSSTTTTIWTVIQRYISSTHSDEK